MLPDGPSPFPGDAADGHGVDWPICYDELAPWYDHVERFTGASGEVIHTPSAPDGVFQAPMPMNAVARAFATRIHARFSDRRVTMARLATLTEPLHGRSSCHYCKYCERGCSPGAYFSSLSATLPAAHTTGRLTMLTDSIAHSVIYDAKRNRASGVRVIDANTRDVRGYRAPLVVVCASAFESVRLLLNSATERFPDGLANSSGVLGKYVMDHFPSDLAVAEFDGPALAWPNQAPLLPRPTFPPPREPRPEIERQLVRKNGDFERLLEWTTIELLAIGDKAAHLINGRIVNTPYEMVGQDIQDRNVYRPLTRGPHTMANYGPALAHRRESCRGWW